MKNTKLSNRWIRGLALSSALALGAAPAVAMASQPIEQPSKTSYVKTVDASTIHLAESEDLAAREAASKQLESYEGGAAVVFIAGGSVLTVFLVVLLIALLI